MPKLLLRLLLRLLVDKVVEYTILAANMEHTNMRLAKSLATELLGTGVILSLESVLDLEAFILWCSPIWVFKLETVDRVFARRSC